MKNVAVDYGDVHYAFGEDGTLKDTEIVIMNRHENQWREVRNHPFAYSKLRPFAAIRINR